MSPDFYTSWGGADFIPPPEPIEIDGHRLLVITGTPTFGWRQSDNDAAAVWAWIGGRVAPVVSAYVGKHGSRPVITVR
jgi:hypothetical protein